MNVVNPAGKTNAPSVEKSCLRRVHIIINYILKRLVMRRIKTNRARGKNNIYNMF